MYVPDELHARLKANGLRPSELFQAAVQAELTRLELEQAADDYLADLIAEVGPASDVDLEVGHVAAVRTFCRADRKPHGVGPRDARTDQLLKACSVIEQLDTTMARRAAQLRYEARRGSVVDALVVAAAEPGGTVLTLDRKDIVPLAARARSVQVMSA